MKVNAYFCGRGARDLGRKYANATGCEQSDHIVVCGGKATHILKTSQSVEDSIMNFEETVAKAKARAAELQLIVNSAEREELITVETAALYSLFAEGKMDDDTYYVSLNQYALIKPAANTAISRLNHKDINAVAAALRNDKCVLRDGHNGGKSSMTVSGVAEFKNGDRHHIVPLFKQYEYFCLNPIGLDEEGKLVLETSSVGACIFPKKHADLFIACQNYQGIGEITNVIVF